MLLLLLLAQLITRTLAWSADTVPVYDHTQGWSPVVEQVVRNYNAAMPATGPQLAYVREAGGCDPVIGAIVVCEDLWAGPGETLLAGTATDLVWARMRLESTFPPNLFVACHEFLHATTAVLDQDFPGPGLSCTDGVPQAWDLLVLNTAYPSDTPITPVPTVGPVPTPVPTVVAPHPKCSDPQWAPRHTKQCPATRERRH